MRIVVAPDSFKECLSAQQVASAIARGWRNAAPEDEIVEIPLADGGEGTTVALTEALGGQLHTVAVTGPLGERIEARFGLANNNETAVIEVAEASGLHCVPAGARDALRATSRGKIGRAHV